MVKAGPIEPRRSAALAAALVLLQSCATLEPFLNDVVPSSNTGQPVAISDLPDKRPPPEISDESVALSDRYASLEGDYISRGLLRTDDGSDVSFDAEKLAAVFVQLATFAEYSPEANRIVARESATPLRRWNNPIRIEMRFGRSVSERQKTNDRAAVADLARRLSAITGHPISMTGSPSNFVIFVMNEDERQAAIPRLATTEPGLTPPIIRALGALSPTEFCAVIGIFDDGDPDHLNRALVFIRAEHPPLLRLSCFHEEIAQGLGLPNDSPIARPSIFNDDEEFALLTRMDEMLLKMLYDPRLIPGMTSAEVAPIALEIARELLNEDTGVQRASNEEN